jgi:hypothetical protein
LTDDGSREFGGLAKGSGDIFGQKQAIFGKNRQKYHKTLRKLWKFAVFPLTLPAPKLHCYERRVLKNPHEYRGFVQEQRNWHSLMRYALTASSGNSIRPERREPRQHRLPRGQAQKENITWQQV